jgi:hypothetical protein
VTITASTIAGNIDTNILGQSVANTAIVNRSGSPNVRIGGTIIANNGSGGDCYSLESFIRDNGYNLTDDGSCGLTGPTDLWNIEPDLLPLADNRGPTQTMAPSPTSPALNKIPSSHSLCLPTDQRGIARPQGSGCDIGALERRSGGAGSPPPISPTDPPTPEPRVSVFPGVVASPYGFSAHFTVLFTSETAGQGEVYFGTSCTGLVSVGTRDLDAGTAEHEVVVTGNDLPGTVGDIGIVPGETYYLEAVTVTSSGTVIDNNDGACYTVTIPTAANPFGFE